MKNVLIIQRRMTEYRIPMFDALRQQLLENDVNLQVAYGTATKAEAMRADTGDLSWGVRIKNLYLHVGKSQLVWQQIPRQLLTEQALIIMSHENGLLKNNLLILHKQRYNNKVKLAFWGHGTNFQAQGKNNIRERLKAWTALQVDWWFAYTALSVDKIIGYGYPAQQITCLNNATDVGMLKVWQANISDDEKGKLLQKLELHGTHLAIFLGGLYREKRLDFLFAAADKIRDRLPDFELLIIGDGPQSEMVRAFAKSRHWCRWAGARHSRAKVLYASLGRIMLNPGAVGLGILDSFALGIPLLTTNCNIHGPEISYLESGRNGFVVNNNLPEYTEMAVKMLCDDSLYQQFKKNCVLDSSKYDLEKMVHNFSIGIMKALAYEKINPYMHSGHSFK